MRMILTKMDTIYNLSTSLDINIDKANDIHQNGYDLKLQHLLAIKLKDRGSCGNTGAWISKQIFKKEIEKRGTLAVKSAAFLIGFWGRVNDL